MASFSPEIPTQSQNTATDPPPSPSPEWGSESLTLKDFTSKGKVPGFGKVVKGNYLSLGCSKFSLHKQHSEVFIHSVKVGVKVLSHCLRRVEAAVMPRRIGHSSVFTRVYAVDQRLTIPISYQGWFELLSEDGKSARPIQSVLELSKLRPEKCLVRENTKAFLPNEEGKLTFDKTKVVTAGEQLVLAGDISLPVPSKNTKIKLLRCFDSRGDCIYLSFDQKGMFTPIATEKDFSGVLQIKDIIQRFRLPLTVKLIQGVKPKVDQSKFTGVIRLDWVYTDETAFVCPIEKNHVRLLPVPTDVNIQLAPANNQVAMKSTELYKSMTLKCNRMITNYNNTIHLIVQVPDAAAKGKNRNNTNVFSGPFQGNLGDSERGKSKAREKRLMDEIDDLYGYIRDGGAPPKSRFTYDSDEESYWEEPAYEPLADFQARLKALEAGQKVSYPVKYQPKDPKTLGLDSALKTQVGSSKPSEAPPPVPPRPPDLLPENLVSLTPKEEPKGAPPVPPRRYSQSDTAAVTSVSNLGMVSSTSSNDSSKSKSRSFHHSKSTDDALDSQKEKQKEYRRSNTTGSRDSNSNSGGSSGGGFAHRKNHIARDFRDSDISSVTKATSSGSSGGKPMSTARKRMQTLYL